MLRDIAPELGTFSPVCNERLQGIADPCRKQVLDHDPKTGRCRILPAEVEALSGDDYRKCSVQRDLADVSKVMGNLETAEKLYLGQSRVQQR